MMTLNQINNNPMFAPLGHEDEFKRRLFLENFRRCMTVRQFQKTAGLEIKKKVEATPTSLIMGNVIKKYDDDFCHERFNISRFFKEIPYDDIYLPSYMKWHDKTNSEFKRLSKLYKTKGSNYSKVIKYKETRFMTAYTFYNKVIKSKKDDYYYHIKDKLLRIGFWNYYNNIVYIYLKVYKKVVGLVGDEPIGLLMFMIKNYDLETKKVEESMAYINFRNEKIDILL